MANNMRVVPFNAADSLATLVASSAVSGLPASNLLSDIKSKVWRAASTAAQLTLTWGSAQSIGLVALPFVNFSSTAKMRVRCYTNTGDALGSALYDTGDVACCPYSPITYWDWGTQPLGVNAFTYGGAAYAVVWLPHQSCRKVVVDIDDPANPAGYIEASRLVAGGYWSPQINASFGAELLMADASEHSRNDAGDLMTRIGPRGKRMGLDLSFMTAMDRQRMYDLVRTNGKTHPFFVSLSPQNTDNPSLEQAHQIWGKFSEVGAQAWVLASTFATKLEIEEV